LGVTPTEWAIVLKPLALIALCGLVLYPIRRAVIRYWPDGKLKRLLLRDIHRDG
jgi:hypothetical protein